MLWDSSATDVVAFWTQDSGYTGTVTFNTVYGETGFTNFTVTGDAVINGGSLTHTRNYMNEVYRLAMTINGNLTVDGGVIHANDGGFNTSAGPGASPNLYGGSHGGKGGGTVAVDNETLSNEMSLKPWTPIPAFAGSTEVIKDTRWSAKNQTKLRVVADTIIGELVIEPPVELDLAGNSLTLKLFSLDGMATTIPADTYTAADLASALVVDSIGGGTVTVLPSSTLIILR